MVNSPVREKESLRRAWPLASSVTHATTLPFTKNVTVPLPAGQRTVAVNVTACPTPTGLTDANRAVVVAWGWQARLRGRAAPTGLRYGMNSAALRLTPPGVAPEERA